VEGGLRLVHDRGRPFLQQVHFIPVSLASAWLHVLQKNPVAARSAFDSARVTADSATRAQPKSPPAHMALAFAWAGLGNAEAATREARTAMALMPSSRDALNGVDYEYIAAQVFAQVGRVNEALSLLEKIYLAPNGPAAADLRLDPRWDPIREQPRFKALLARGVN
jgi:serine/threonine-protein kinase